MTLLAFSLYDTKTAVFSPPFFMNHLGSAMRAVEELASDKRTLVGRYPSDYHFFQIGSFDESTGVMESVPPVNHGPVTQFLPQQPPLPLEQATTAGERGEY